MLAVLCVSCEAACDLLQPRIMSSLIDNGAAKADLGYVLRTGLLMLGIVGLGAVFALVRNAIASNVSQSFGAELRLDLFKKFQSLSLDEMDRFEGGSLVTRMTNDVTQMQNFVNGMMRIFFKAPVMCIGAIVMAATLDWKTVPVILPIVALVGVVIAGSMRLAYPRFARVQAALDKLNTTMREFLAGIRLVKAFRRFKEEEAHFRTANDGLTDDTVRANRILAIFSPCMALFVNFGVAAILLLGARWVDAGETQVGQIMAFITYMAQIMTSLNMISNVLNMLVRVNASNGRIAEVMDIAPVSARQAVQDSKTERDAPHIVFDHVGFAYSGSTGQPALTDVSFSVRRGQTLGIIGSTGSGKSTVAALLMRFYEPTRGEIRLDGVPLGQLSEKAWRERIAIVPQIAMLFSGTIRENILWGRETATEEEMLSAARAAQADEFIAASPYGYDAMIGQGGVNLSGGQKQRVSIARALVRAPEVLVLDDCTSALDVITEAKVKRGIRQYSMTCVLVTQRIATAMTCDRVLVLDNGRAVGLGSHGELMERCPEYRDIYVSQIGREAV